MADVAPKQIQKDRRLETWKQIAEYLNKDVRTVIRWEKERGLPVHRMPGQKRSGVYAWPSEIDAWLRSPADDPFGKSGSETAISEIKTDAAPSRRRRAWVLFAALVPLVLLAAAAGVWRLWPRTIRPQLGRSIQVTSDPREKRELIVGGSTLFLDSLEGALETVTRIDQNGGKRSFLPFTHGTFDLQDISPNGSELLVTRQATQGCSSELWVVRADGRASWKLAGLCADAAAWSPDGRRLAYVLAHALYLASPDGTHPHKVVTLPSNGDHLQWSPTGNRLRLSVEEPKHCYRLWEVSMDRPVARILLPGWSRTDKDLEFAGRWTPDGKFFVFLALHNGTHDLWAIHEKTGLFDWRDPGPFQLTASLNGVGSPALSRDGKRLFAIVTAPLHGELMRYDSGVHRFTKYLDQNGFSGAHTSFSPDGNQIVYVTYPDMRLWKINVDGGGSQILTDHALLPQWSPDGHWIAFMGHNDDNRQPTKIHVISAEGGQPGQPVPSPEWQGAPTWTADGSGLIFGDNGPFFPIRESCAIHVFDLKSGKVSDLPGSTGLWTARASPAGRFIAAVTRDDRRLVLYDMRTAAWTELATFADSLIGDNPTWSKDGNFLYFDAPFSADPAIYRISVPGKRMERVASLKGIQRVHGDLGVWLGLTPDNCPLILRATEANEIYAWDWIAP